MGHRATRIKFDDKWIVINIANVTYWEYRKPKAEGGAAIEIHFVAGKEPLVFSGETAKELNEHLVSAFAK
jgi:hypothetical protein